jgi:Holliday junction resolvasome RuvABC ATP-dependent DNA helicase subunit
MTNRFDDVQKAAQKNAAQILLNLNTESLAKQITAASHGDPRVAYDFLDTLNKHVTDILQGRKQ